MVNSRRFNVFVKNDDRGEEKTRRENVVRRVSTFSGPLPRLPIPKNLLIISPPQSTPSSPRTLPTTSPPHMLSSSSPKLPKIESCSHLSSESSPCPSSPTLSLPPCPIVPRAWRRRSSMTLFSVKLDPVSPTFHPNSKNSLVSSSSFSGRQLMATDLDEPMSFDEIMERFPHYI